ncbi:MAG: MFS transporter [Bryobacterales bacterium]
MQRLYYGWFIAASCFFILAMTVGVPLYAMPFFYDYYIAEFGWSRAETTAGIAISTIVILPLGGLLIHCFSARKLILFGVVCFALALNGFGLMGGSLAAYYLIWCVVMLGYVYSGPIPNQVILSQWFSRNRGKAMALAYLGLGIGGAISQKFVALPLINAFGWRTALQIMGALTLLVIPILIWVVRDRPADKGLFADGDAVPATDFGAKPHDFHYLLRQRSFWFLAFGSFCSIGAIGSINQHMKLMFQDVGLSASVVADTTFVILVSSLAGRIVMGWLADRMTKKYVMVAAYIFVGAPIPLLYIVDQPSIPFLFAVAFGFGLGADFMLIPLMAAEVFGPNSLARVMGIILPVDSIGQTVFPFLLGYMYDQAGNYHAGLAVVFSLAMIGAGAIAMLPKHHPAAQSAAKI